MNDVGVTYDLVTQLTQRSELDRFAADRRIAAADIDTAERQRRQLLRDVGNVEHIARAAREFKALMLDCMDEVTRAIKKHGVAA